MQRQNVLLAVKFFDEKMIAALNIQNNDEVNGTAEFMFIILKWWKIMNVRTPNTGYHLQDPFRNPITSMECNNVQYLLKFSSFLSAWESLVLPTSSDSKAGKLTKDTFVALKHTTDAIIEIIRHMFHTYPNKKYLLLGKFQTDNLEGRFGKYRFMSGCNYHVSVQ